MALSLDTATEKVVRQYGKQRGLEAKDAAKRLIEVAVGRLAALKKYATKMAVKPGKGKKGKAKKAGRKSGGRPALKKAA